MAAVIYLLDTNVLSEPLKPKPDSTVMKKIERHRTESGTAAIVLHELYFGMNRLPTSKLKTNLQIYLRSLLDNQLTVFDYDEEAAIWHAAERARLQARGMTPVFADGQIAAVSAVNGLTLVSRSTVDFSHFEGIKIQDWFSH